MPLPNIRSSPSARARLAILCACACLAATAQAQGALTAGERARRVAVVEALIDHRTEWQRAPTRWIACSIERAMGEGVVPALARATRARLVTRPARPDTACTTAAYRVAGTRTIRVRDVLVTYPDSARSITQGTGWPQRPHYVVALEVDEGGCRTEAARIELAPRWRRAVGPDPDDERWTDVQVVRSELRTVMELSHCACLSRGCAEGVGARGHIHGAGVAVRPRRGSAVATVSLAHRPHRMRTMATALVIHDGAVRPVVDTRGFAAEVGAEG